MGRRRLNITEKISRCMPDTHSSHNLSSTQPNGRNAALVLEDGTIFWGYGAGVCNLPFDQTAGEICFNTSLTGYQEILTDPSYAGQIIVFTFPHIGNVGTNDEDNEAMFPVNKGCVLATDITEPANWRSGQCLDTWLKTNKLSAVTGIDTRQLTRRIRDEGYVNGVIAYSDDSLIDVETAVKAARACPTLEGLDLAKQVTCKNNYNWNETKSYSDQGHEDASREKYNVVVMDFGVKRNILRSLTAAGCKLTVVPADTSAEKILGHKPDGIFLSNGPGDPQATGSYAVPTIQKLVKTGIPIFGICLGHQILALALGASTCKMHHGHHGANHPVKDLETGKIEITSQNHGFVVERNYIPVGVIETHISLFDSTLEGIRVEGSPIFSVQHHPESSPGPHDSHYLFDRFVNFMAMG